MNIWHIFTQKGTKHYCYGEAPFKFYFPSRSVSFSALHTVHGDEATRHCWPLFVYKNSYNNVVSNLSRFLPAVPTDPAACWGVTGKCLMHAVLQFPKIIMKGKGRKMSTQELWGNIIIFFPPLNLGRGKM